MNCLFKSVVFTEVEDKNGEPVIVECIGKCKAKDFRKNVRSV